MDNSSDAGFNWAQILLLLLAVALVIGLFVIRMSKLHRARIGEAAAKSSESQPDGTWVLKYVLFFVAVWLVIEVIAITALGTKASKTFESVATTIQTLPPTSQQTEALKKP